MLRFALRASVVAGAAFGWWPAFGQTASHPTVAEAMAAQYPGEKLSEWNRAGGDFNGDGLDDLALILTTVDTDVPLQTRLLVLAGAPGGRYSVLSGSSRYCVSQKFFNLESKGASLYVSAVQKADANEMGSETLQFQFNRQLGDMVVIGSELVSESFSDGAYERLSVNYLSGVSIHYARVRGHIQETRRSKFAVSAPARLKGFDCETWPGQAAP